MSNSKFNENVNVFKHGVCPSMAIRVTSYMVDQTLRISVRELKQSIKKYQGMSKLKSEFVDRILNLIVEQTFKFCQKIV